MGRPKKTQDIPPDEGGDVGLSEAPKKNRKLAAVEAFWQTVEEHRENEAIVFYIYRLWPRIDRKLSGSTTTNIGKLTAISEKILLREYGTGTYHVRMNDTSRGKGVQIADAKIEVADPDLPPVLDINEVDRGWEGNKSYLEGLRIRGLLPEQKEGTVANAEAGAAAQAVQTLGAIASEVLTKRNSGSDLANLKDLAAVMKSMAPAAAPAADNSKLLELMMTQQTTLITALLAQKPGASSSSDPLESISKAVGLIDKLRGSGRGGGSGGGSSWVSDLLKVLPAVAPAFADSLRSMATLRGVPVAMEPGGLAVVPAPVGAPVAAFPAVPVVSVPPGGDDMNVMMLRFVAVGKKALSAFQRGVTGDAFASSLVDFEDDGEAVYAALYEMGREGILQALQSVPGSAQYATMEPQIKAWIDAFVSYGEPEPGEGADGGAV